MGALPLQDLPLCHSPSCLLFSVGLFKASNFTPFFLTIHPYYITVHKQQQSLSERQLVLYILSLYCYNIYTYIIYISIYVLVLYHSSQATAKKGRQAAT
jgi:hypothetical protein